MAPGVLNFLKDYKLECARREGASVDLDNRSYVPGSPLGTTDPEARGRQRRPQKWIEVEVGSCGVGDVIPGRAKPIRNFGVTYSKTLVPLHRWNELSHVYGEFCRQCGSDMSRTTLDRETGLCILHHPEAVELDVQRAYFD